MEEFRRYFLVYKGVKTKIKEPIGFDGFETTIGRNEKSHGIGIEYARVSLKFHDNAAIDILKAAYADDIDNEVFFTSSYNDVEEYKGVINLKSYREVYDKYHYIELEIGDIGVETTFFNRQEQKVDLNSLTAFDGAALPEYPMLKKTIILPAKDLLLTSELNAENHRDFAPDDFHPSGLFYAQPTISEAAMSELDAAYTMNSVWSSNIGDVRNNVFFRYFTNNETNSENFNIEINCKGQFGINRPLITKLELVVEKNKTEIGRKLIYEGQALNKVDFDQQLAYSFASLNNQDEFCFYFAVTCIKYNHATPFTFYDSVFNIKITALNKYPDTTTECSLVHEALSRIVEATTNGAISVRSDFYGRADSGVFPTHQSGREAFRALAMGLNIRNAVYKDKAKPLFTLSFADIFKGLQPIDNIGYGFVWEDGKRLLRIEPYEWFYSNNEVVLDVAKPRYKKTSVDLDNLFLSFKIGYKKYETEGTNGIDAIMTEREYRTRSTVAEGKLEQVSEFIADTYAIEATRRKANDKDTKDWRYDNDTFVVQLHNDYTVEQIGFSDNVISADTLYNVRLSPARCARRWLSRLFGWSSKPEQLIFTSGTGNVNAKVAVDFLLISGVVYPYDYVSENENIESDATPVLKAELTEFDYPITISQYKAILQNPYGIIKLDGVSYRLCEMKYKWKSRVAGFKVWPVFVPQYESNQ